MKYNKILKVAAVGTTLFLGSCISDLDVKPLTSNVKTSANVYDSPEAYKGGLAKLYASFVLTGQQGPAGQSDLAASFDEGNSSFTRLLWNFQELSTDEAVWTYTGDFGGTLGNLHYHTWTSADSYIELMFARIMAIEVIINEYIRVTAGTDNADLKLFNAEARFLRAMGYYYGMDLFGKMPFVTEADEPGAFLPQQISRADLFAYIESELLDIQDKLGDAGFEYGRADKGACAFLLAKLYLNAEVYIGSPKYTEAITQLKKFLAGGEFSGAYSLAPNYLDNFLADNNTSPELIFTLNSDGEKSQSYESIWTMIKGNTNGWGGIRTTKSLVEKFDNGDTRDHFLTANQTLEIEEINQRGQGYGVYKFRNINKDGSTPASDITGFTNVDNPMFRLADAYLMYAEAVLRGGTGGDVNTALTAVNALRNRENETPIGDISLGELDLDFILDERARELYFEHQRRTDLIRFDRFTGGDYLWPWKGNVKEGTSTESFRNVFPIPSSDLASNPNLEPNDGY